MIYGDIVCDTHIFVKRFFEIFSSFFYYFNYATIKSKLFLVIKSSLSLKIFFYSCTERIYSFLIPPLSEGGRGELLSERTQFFTERTNFCRERIYSFLFRISPPSLRGGRGEFLYGTHLFVPSSVVFHMEAGMNKSVPYRQNGIQTELGTNKCVPYRIECVPKNFLIFYCRFRIFFTVIISILFSL